MSKELTKKSWFLSRTYLHCDNPSPYIIILYGYASASAVEFAIHVNNEIVEVDMRRTSLQLITVTNYLDYPSRTITSATRILTVVF